MSSVQGFLRSCPAVRRPHTAALNCPIQNTDVLHCASDARPLQHLQPRRCYSCRCPPRCLQVAGRHSDALARFSHCSSQKPRPLCHRAGPVNLQSAHRPEIIKMRLSLPRSPRLAITVQRVQRDVRCLASPSMQSPASVGAAARELQATSGSPT